ncbi:MAG TPA: glycoside hydrolase family 2 protein [Acidobacteriaceae bacterium]|nr:glycoside hydrolase family 2 protein [Acidobacteriaceae bacterium]
MFRKIAITFLLLACAFAAPAATTPLHEGWQLQSACKLQTNGDTISTAGFKPDGWIATSVPATVLAAQVAAGIYPDPYYGLNLRKIPGETYPMGKFFANLPIPDDSPYKCGWWYRKEFALPAADKGRTLWLHFGGINYRADVWVNGKKIADQSQVAGAYRTYDFDITGVAEPGKPNVIAVETWAPGPKDLGINWVDWNPAPPDKDMGLWGDVTLGTTGPVTLRSPMAVTHFTDASLSEADLTLYAELHNASDHAVTGKVTALVASVPVEQNVTIAAGADQTVVFASDQFTQLRIHHPHVWWPYVMGDPHLERLTMRFVENGSVSDEQSVDFGIREITTEKTDKGYELFKVNGKPILIRGGGWSQDMLLRQNPERLRNELRLFRDIGLNTIRLEGKMETDDFFQLADRQGILVMLGWCCCDQWEHWKEWTPENYTVAAGSLRSQMLRLRSHPSLLVWLNGSDNPPPAFVETAYRNIEAETHWPNPILSSASATPTTVTGPSGVKMTGPYDYVAPSYWYVDTKHGGAFGYNTETSPGPDVPNVASLRKFIPPDQLWPPAEAWSYHDGGGDFTNLHVFDTAMRATYGQADTLVEYERLAQAMSYDSERAMYEAYSRNKYNSTGVIQWMLNNAWPSMIWHLFDYYLDADGGYFGAKKACEPVHVQYSYDDHSIVVVNSTYSPVDGLTASAHVYDIHLKPLFSAEKQLNAASDRSNRVINVPDSVFQQGSQVYFVDLMLKDAKGSVVSRNFYWIPAKLTVFDWKKTDYTHTPATEPANMQDLRSLPQAAIQAQLHEHPSPTGETVEVTLHNPSQALAFQIWAAVRTKGGDLVAPVLWSDNYVELMPGESRTLTAVLPQHAPSDLVVKLTGWNVPDQTLPVGGR